jgi:NADH dehydrogenase FAD-containing subunit
MSSMTARGHQVTIIAHGYAVGEKIDDTTRPAVEASSRNGQVRVITGTDVVGMTGRVVHLRDAFTMRHWNIEADTLVYDVGGRARDELYAALRAQVSVPRRRLSRAARLGRSVPRRV